MQRYVCLVDIGPQAMAFQANAGRPSASRYPSLFCREGEEVPPGFAPAHRFEAESIEEANGYFRSCQERGMPSDPNCIGRASNSSGPSLWRWRGDRHYIKARLADFGLGDHTERRLQANPQFRQITTLLGQQCQLYHDSRKEDGVAIVPEYRMGFVRSSLAEAEKSVADLGVLLCAAIDAMDAAYRAFGVDHDRGYEVTFGRKEGAESPVRSLSAHERDASAHAEPEAVEPSHPKRPHPKQAATAGAK